ncbi:MAG: YopX family protein [Flavobacteriaceae bacterium]|nr:YopX family protein [Flavobacteriaceae bacterium]
MRSKIQKYRLRDDKTIVGYAEETAEGMLFTGKFPLFWLKSKQKFSHVDQAVGILDKLNRMIYEYDILSYKINDSQMRREGIVLWSEEKLAFGIFDIESRHFSFFFVGNLFLFEKDKVEIISHAFNRPKLMAEFKL